MSTSYGNAISLSMTEDETANAIRIAEETIREVRERMGMDFASSRPGLNL